MKKLMMLVLLLPLLANADGVPMNPGKWEMEMTMQMSMLPQPQVRTSTECITEEQLSPENFNMDEDSPCDVSELNVDGNTVSWSISCPGPMGSMEGNWEFTSSGDEIVGNGSMSGSMGNMTMQMDMDWTGKRIGDCD